MNFKVLQYRYIYFSVMWILFLISLGFMFFSKLNLGIDMTGGTQIEFTTSQEIRIDELSQIAQEKKEEMNQKNVIVNNVNVYQVTWENIFVVEAWFSQHYEDAVLAEYKVQFRDELAKAFFQKNAAELTKYTNIGASFWKYIQDTAILTLFLAIIGITLYLVFAFSATVSWISAWSFWAITIITLAHDVIIASGFYIATSLFLPQFQIDTFFVTALLTILWYSINDTIVIFDRIRSNLRKYAGRGKDLATIIEESINETFIRSIYTSLTLVFTLLSILIVGPETIKGFTLVMLYGTLVGSFSSIFIASPLLYEIHKNTLLTVYQKPKDISDDDKMVV